MSKAYGMAGIRFGYALADETLIQYFRKMQIPWNASLLSMAAAEAALDEEEELKRKAAYNNAGVDYVVQELSKMPGVKPYSSHGNYVFIDATDAGVTGKEIVDYVFEKDGIMIKAFAPFRGRERILPDCPRDPRREHPLRPGHQTVPGRPRKEKKG